MQLPRYALLLPLLAIASPVAHAAPEKAAPKVAVPQVVLRVAAERAEPVYKVGEEVRFVVRVTQDDKPVQEGRLTYVLDDEGPNRLASDAVELSGKPVVITGRMDKPGFLRCRVALSLKSRAIVATAAAAVSPEKIQPSMPAPDDFDAFWQKQKARLAEVPMDPKLTKVDSPDPAVECFDVQVPCAGGAPVSGYFARPKDGTKKSLPAILWVHGAGVRSSVLENAVRGAKLGMLSMDINAHGIPNGKPVDYYARLAREDLRDYRHRGRESRDTYYFLGMYLRLVRAIDFLTAQPQWDGKVVAVIGHSQGGGQALVAGGLDDRVTFVATGVPAMCDHTGMVADRVAGWPKLVPTGPDGKPDPKVLETARYFDAVNFAARCKADAIMSVGFVDTVCPPTTNYAAYNQLKGHKEVLNEPQMGHAAPSHINDAFLEAIQAHVKEHQPN